MLKVHAQVPDSDNRSEFSNSAQDMLASLVKSTTWASESSIFLLADSYEWTKDAAVGVVDGGHSVRWFHPSECFYGI